MRRYVLMHGYRGEYMRWRDWWPVLREAAGYVFRRNYDNSRISPRLAVQIAMAGQGVWRVDDLRIRKLPTGGTP